MRLPALALLAFVALSAGACDQFLPDADRTRPQTARDFPRADRPVAHIESTRWSDEESRDRVNEAEDVMDRAGIKPGMTVADIGAGEGYYTIRLARRVGSEGRVLAQDILPEVRDSLAMRVSSSQSSRHQPTRSGQGISGSDRGSSGVSNTTV